MQNFSHSRSGVGAGQLFMLDPWEEVPLAVIPSRSSVVLPQTQQQVRRQRIAGRTRAVQLCRTVKTLVCPAEETCVSAVTAQVSARTICMQFEGHSTAMS